MLKSSSLCLYSSNLGTFWLKIEQFWPFEEISIFSNSSHLEWRTGLSDTILKWDYPRIIPAKLDLIWFSGFREDDLNVIFYQNMPNLHNRYKSAERNISHKKTEYVKLLLAMQLQLKVTHPGTIPARFGLIWFSGFRGEYLKVKVYDVRRIVNARRQVMTKNELSQKSINTT